MPVAAVSRDERLDGITRELGLDGKYLLHVGDKNLGKKLFRALADASAEQEEIRKLMGERTAAYKRKLDGMGEYLKEYLQRSLS